MGIPVHYPELRNVPPGSRVPVWQELPADLETPVSVYLKLRQKGVPSFLLESVEKGERLGRYSFLGTEPIGLLLARDGEVLYEEPVGTLAARARGDPLVLAREVLHRYRPVEIAPSLPRFCGGLVGYLSYDATRFFERVPLAPRPGLGLPDAVWLLVDDMVIFDHVRHRLLVVAHARVDGNARSACAEAAERVERLIARLEQPMPEAPRRPPTPMEGPGLQWDSNCSQETFEAMVRRAKAYIAAGDIFQVVLSQRFSRITTASPFAIYRVLRMLNPSPYMFFLELPDDLYLVGASPEVLTRLEGGVAEVRPIAGTRPRGAGPEEDAALEQALMADEKERAEHVMLVDLARNDLGRVCRYGTVHVPELMVVERYSHVMHIVSSVRGELRPDVDAFDLLRATFPAGTVSGAPKVRAMEIIAELEGERRGPYAGGVGYFSYTGAMDTCITIRTLIMHGNTVHVQAGAGIVADSDPTREYQETCHKARALMEAVRLAEQWR
ncbi:MAG: anthranilate synthase component I [Anaerolineae bacterium]|nr:anthranilate synthase component I [Anaerolineae bacterium]MDW8067499.1 anthranilate synthase component I [Anaerolineae bacterium]